VPPPWTCKAEAWLLILTLGSKLPDGAYAPLEAGFKDFADPEHAGKFKGQIGFLMVLRYSETPVGKHDLAIQFPKRTKAVQYRCCRHRCRCGRFMCARNRI
jgi:hypothetical protein